MEKNDYTGQKTKMEYVKKAILESKYLVCLKGRGLSDYFGYTNYYNQQDAYAVEAKYGYSPEEILSASFYNTRVEQFYEFLKQEMLKDLENVPQGLETLANLEEKGILKATITRDVFSIAARAGCKHVLELHGNIFHYQCPHCKAEYELDYVLEQKGVPKCRKCATAIRPQMRLVGEMVDNNLVTKSSQEVAKADVLLILGCHMNEYLVQTLLRYFKGTRVILIKSEKHYQDHKADLVLYGNPIDILASLGV